MTMLPPTPPRMDMGNFPYRIDGYTNTTPFTHRDGMTFLRKLESLQHWLMTDLVPHVDTSIAMYVDAFNKALGDIQAYMEGQQVIIDDKIADFIALAQNSTDALNALVAAAKADIGADVTAAEAAKDAAEAARDLAETYAAEAGAKADNSIALFVNKIDSATRIAINAVIAGLVHDMTDNAILAKVRPQISVTHKLITINGKTVPYAVTRVSGGGFMPLSSGVLKKRFGSDFDVTNPNAVNEAFKPVGEFMDSYASRTNSLIAANAAPWKVSGDNVNELYGAQIKDGKKFHEATPNLAGTVWGVEGVGVKADGKMLCYSALRGDTADSMIADGVVHSWFGGPNLIVNGVGQDLTLKNWGAFLTEISARTVIGQSANGDYVVISIVGKTGNSGLTGAECVRVAQAENLFNASLFDGGGSTQLYARGEYAVPSSDGLDGVDTTFGKRKTGDVILFSGELITSPNDTGWRNIVLRNGFTAGTVTPQVRMKNGFVECRGQVVAAFDATTNIVGDLPQQFGHETAAKPFIGLGEGNATRKVSVLSDRSIQVLGKTGEPTGYVNLDLIRWSTFK